MKQPVDEMHRELWIDAPPSSNRPEWGRPVYSQSSESNDSYSGLTGSALGIRPKARIRTPTRCGARGEELQANRFLRGASLLLVSSVLVGHWARTRGLARQDPNARLNSPKRKEGLPWPEWRSGAGVKVRKYGRGG